MTDSSVTRFFAVFRIEVLLNTRRVAPYVLMILFAGNALLWWGWGPASRLGWATNSEYYIVRNLVAFSFLLGLPIFNAVIMADTVIRDYRLRVDALIFSKPIKTWEYLLGKFCGNFFVLVCCQSVFVLTLVALQATRTAQMAMLPVRIVPYFKHFFLLVVITHFLLAAFYFTVGTLTRNAKIVYGLCVCFYPAYVMYGLVFLRKFPQNWRTVFDLFLLDFPVPGGGFTHTADFLNQLVVRYSPGMMANRALVILAGVACLALVFFRFAIATAAKKADTFSILNLSSEGNKVYFDYPGFQPLPSALVAPVQISLPRITIGQPGLRTTTAKLLAALAVEFRLLGAERSLLVVFPLTVALSIFELIFYRVVPQGSYSAHYAGNTAGTLLLFLVGIIIFYTGEAMHRDREIRVEPVLWATPAPNSVLLMSKFLATFCLTLSLVAIVGVGAIIIQLLRGHTPIEIQPYLFASLIILVPNIVFLTATSVSLNVLLRNKYLTYVISIGTGAALFYLYSVGYNHWLYNPLLYRLWTYSDLTNGTNLSIILVHRIYCAAIAVACIGLAHLAFERKTAKGVANHVWAVVILLSAIVIAVGSGVVITKYV
jgi:ABC-type transport system involved in multi-copper enzyme maturation permease subunit